MCFFNRITILDHEYILPKLKRLAERDELNNAYCEKVVSLSEKIKKLTQEIEDSSYYLADPKVSLDMSKIIFEEIKKKRKTREEEENVFLLTAIKKRENLYKKSLLFKEIKTRIKYSKRMSDHKLEQKLLNWYYRYKI